MPPARVTVDNDSLKHRHPIAPRKRVTGPYSKLIERGAISSFIDGRSREGRFLRAYEQGLFKHCNNSPTTVQQYLIRQASRLALHLELMDEKALAGEYVFTAHSNNHYIAWSNALARTLQKIGVEPTAPPRPTLADLLKRSAA